ncbi:MAG: hypothetical protein Q4E09_02530 [Eubacteriales bacterium]|nr:hypothetical protein [Eubacteriales bacterium]
MNKLKSWALARQTAAISILLALICPVLVLLFLASQALSERMIAEYTAARLTKSAGKIILASYDRDLWQNFGLWAIQEEDIDLKLIESALESQPKILERKFSYELSGNIFEPQILKEQVLRYMKLRAPVILSSEMLHRARSAAEGRQSLVRGSTAGSLNQLHEASSAEEKFLKAQAGLDSLEEGQTDLQSENLLEQLPTEELETFLPLIETMARQFLPVYEALGTTAPPPAEAFRPSNIEKLARKLDELLDFAYLEDWERLCLAEYCLLLFPAQVNVEKKFQSQSYLLTPNGQKLADLAEKRPLELEQLATGKRSARAAGRQAELLICAMRFVAQYLAGSKMPDRQAHYQRLGHILAALVTLVSLGQVPAEAEQFVPLIQAVDSFKLARGDLRDLGQGYGLPFWPSEALSYMRDGFLQADFYYRDYLRLLLWTRSPDDLVKDLARIIQNERRTAGFRQASVALVVNGRTLSYDFSLDFELPEITAE